MIKCQGKGWVWLQYIHQVKNIKDIITYFFLWSVDSSSLELHYFFPIHDDESFPKTFRYLTSLCSIFIFWKNHKKILHIPHDQHYFLSAVTFHKQNYSKFRALTDPKMWNMLFPEGFWNNFYLKKIHIKGLLHRNSSVVKSLIFQRENVKHDDS